MSTSIGQRLETLSTTALKNKNIAYRIVLPYQETGHQDRPWFLMRVDAFDNEKIIAYLKIAWVEYSWVIDNYEITYKAIALRSSREFLRWLRDRGNYCYVDFSRVSYQYRRRGVATNLYQLGAAWLATHRRAALHGSDIQSESAKRFWKSLHQNSNVPAHKKIFWDKRRNREVIRQYIDYSSSLKLRLIAKALLHRIPCQTGPEKFDFFHTDPNSLKFKQ